MIIAVLVKEHGAGTLYLNANKPGVLTDYSRPLGPDDLVDGRPVWDWADGVHQVTEYPDELPTQPSVAPTTLSNGSVVYEKDQVTAYFNAHDRPVPEAMATWKKVWTVKNGRTQLKIISLQEATNG